MWEIFEEDYTDPNTGITWTHQKAIKRSDGFTLIRHGLNKEGWQTFVCRTGLVEFKFCARRWYGELDNGKLLDIYPMLKI